MRATLEPVGLVMLSAFLSVVAAGCGPECAKDFDCGNGDQCNDGVCFPATDDNIELVAPTGRVEGSFDLTLAVRFRGPSAILRVSKLSGDACLPFIPVELLLTGDGSERTTQEVTVPGVLSQGPQFRLRASMNIAGKEVTTIFDFEGAPIDASVGGFEFAGEADEVDVVSAPWFSVAGAVAGGSASAYVEAVGVVPDSTPRRVIAEASPVAEGFLPLPRGPSILWVESDSASGVRRCGRGLLGGPVRDDEGAIEFALLTEEDDALLGLSLKLSNPGTAELICDDSRTDPRCEDVRRSSAPQPQNSEIVRITASDGIVEVAAVPRAISGPVTAWVRVTRAGRHAGFFGPFTLFPGVGQSWVAGRVVLQGGQVFGLVPVDELVIGAPW